MTIALFGLFNVFQAGKAMPSNRHNEKSIFAPQISNCLRNIRLC